MKGAEARGQRTANGFVVFSGSTAVLEERPSTEKYPYVVAQRKQLIADHTLVERDGFLVFTKDAELFSPSVAAVVVHGGSANGLTSWISKDGKSLKYHGLVKHKRRGRPKLQGTGLCDVNAPNDLWCTDYKGEFMLTDRRYCYPLTVTDFSSRLKLRELARMVNAEIGKARELVAECKRWGASNVWHPAIEETTGHRTRRKILP